MIFTLFFCLAGACHADQTLAAYQSAAQCRWAAERAAPYAAPYRPRCEASRVHWRPVR